MNLPNKLTILRVIMIPFFAVSMLLSTGGGLAAEAIELEPARFIAWRVVSLVIFLLASFTDFLDGFIARKYNYITDFGKFLDPVADKMLVCSALILFLAERSICVWVVLVIIAREFIISAFRLVAAENGVVIAASMWGKVKTVFQVILCVVLILPGFSLFIGSVIMWILEAWVVVLTIISLVDYIYKNISVITSGGM